jgi:Uncharacterised protein family (UPF0158)
MSVVVSLKNVVAAMDFQSDEATAYLNRGTGEIETVNDEDRCFAEDETADVQKLPAWQRASVLKARQVLDSADFVPLPDKFEIHEWAIMERFAISQTSRTTRAELIDAIHGRGAFRMFQDTVRRLGIEEAWLAFREAAFEDIARDWLESHDIPYA